MEDHNTATFPSKKLVICPIFCPRSFFKLSNLAYSLHSGIFYAPLTSYVTFVYDMVIQIFTLKRTLWLMSCHFPYGCRYYNLDAYYQRKMEKDLKKGIAKGTASERTVFNDEEQRR